MLKVTLLTEMISPLYSLAKANQLRIRKDNDLIRALAARRRRRRRTLVPWAVLVEDLFTLLAKRFLIFLKLH